MREFKDSITGNSKHDETEPRSELSPATASKPEATGAQRESATQRSA
jgi:hypothetical protein